MRIAVMLVVGLLARGTADACSGSECLQIWSTEAGGGALTIEWDFSRTVAVFESFCAGEPLRCLYSAIDPGFLSETFDRNPGDDLHRLVDGTRVSVEVVSVDPATSLNVNGRELGRIGDRAVLGTMPTIHVHPAWQILAGPGSSEAHSLAFRLTTDSPVYSPSAVYAVTLTNGRAGATPTPTATPASEPAACAGDCDADGAVTVDEILVCVRIALEAAGAACGACDATADGVVTVDDILAAVAAALAGCPGPPASTFSAIQATIFTPRCAVLACHDASTRAGNLSLADEQAYADLVGVLPDTLPARQAGFLRVDPGAPDNSFLVLKLIGPPAGQGSRMPLASPALTDAAVRAVREWIARGASP